MSYSFFDSDPIEYRYRHARALYDSPREEPPMKREESASGGVPFFTNSMGENVASMEQIMGREEHSFLRGHALSLLTHEALIGARPARSTRDARPPAHHLRLRSHDRC